VSARSVETTRGKPLPPLPDEFVDAHHHLWDLDTYEYDWLMGDGWPDKTESLGDYAAIRRSYLVEDLLRDFDGCRVTKSVHLQADLTGPNPDPVIETRWLQRQADATGYPHAIVAWTDLRSPNAAADLERHLESANMRGVRMLVDRDGLSDDAVDRGCRALADRGLSYDLAVTWELMTDARRFAARHGRLSIILEHTGLPMSRTDDYFRSWSGGMRELAAAPNVTVKISGLGTVDHAWTVDSLRPWVLETIEIFGPERTMFGTNWPVDRLYSSYRELVGAYAELIAGFTGAERDAMSARNAERVYRI
jgi:predicted TIM-barrel fold metal-dependent hydrolase